VCVCVILGPSICDNCCNKINSSYTRFWIIGHFLKCDHSDVNVPVMSEERHNALIFNSDKLWEHVFVFFVKSPSKTVSTVQ